jgi:acyl-CoA thioester hydrolase
VNDKPTKAVPRLSDFPHQVRDIVRFRDMDAQGHVNNAAYSTYFETGRVVMFRDPDLSVGIANVTFVLVHADIHFLRELRWPGDLMVGTALKSFGRRSFVVAQSVFQGEDCAAYGTFTMVTLNKTTREPIPLPAEVITRLSPWKGKGQN